MYIVISSTSDTPIYQQIAEGIKNNIASGSLAPGDSLPSIRLFAKELGVSVITTKKAYELLESQGFITTVPQKGSVVSAKSVSIAAEQKRAVMEQHIFAAMDNAKELDIGEDEFIEIIQSFFREGF